MDWSPEEERARLGAGQYDDFGWKAARTLLGKLPHPRPSLEDLHQEVMFWALEAIELYVPY